MAHGPKYVNLLEENLEENLCDIATYKDFLGY